VGGIWLAYRPFCFVGYLRHTHWDVSDLAKQQKEEVMKTVPHFEIFKDHNDCWRWRLVASNSKIVADCCEGYYSKANVRRAIKRVMLIFTVGCLIPIKEVEY
jgi:uncharacterized protein YegP (UPF0339 family)